MEGSFASRIWHDAPWRGRADRCAGWLAVSNCYAINVRDSRIYDSRNDTACHTSTAEFVSKSGEGLNSRSRTQTSGRNQQKKNGPQQNLRPTKAPSSLRFHLNQTWQA